MKSFYGYMLCSRKNGTLYTGVTSDLIKRAYEHKNNLVAGFTKKFNIHSLVWYEAHDSIEVAIQREKQIKKWERPWKLRLIEKLNPQWKDLYADLLEEPGFASSRE
jgi:putative endonuclease